MKNLKSITTDKFRDKAGRLSGYALACGYIEEFTNKGKSVTLWRENECLHVRLHDFNIGKRIFWECPKTITEARKLFDKTVKEIKLN